MNNYSTSEFRKAKIVRCVKDPMLPGQKPKQAIFVPDVPDCDAYLHLPTGNVWFVFHKFKREMMVGIGNIEMVEPFWEDDNGKIQDIAGTRKKKNETTASGAI